MAVDEEVLARKFERLLPHLDERQRRLWMAVEADSLGRGGLTAVCRAAKVSAPTVRKGLRELGEGIELTGRVRRPGGGRKLATTRDPGLLVALDRLVDPDTRGDAESPLRWTCKSTRQLADALTETGHPVSSTTVAELLVGELKFSLQANAKVREGKQHPDRDGQFRHINDFVRRFLNAGDPVISVDTKKKVRADRGRPGLQERRAGVEAHQVPRAGRRARLPRPGPQSHPLRRLGLGRQRWVRLARR